MRGLYVCGDSLDGEECCAALGAPVALLAERTGAPVLGGHVGLTAHRQRELLAAEPTVVLHPQHGEHDCIFAGGGGEVISFFLVVHTSIKISRYFGNI